MTDTFSKPGEAVTIYSLRGAKVARSRNLRGVLRYAGKHGVTQWLMTMTDDYGAKVRITFRDEATAAFQFASWDVAQRWLRARRSWGLRAASIKPTCEIWSAQ